jgi:sec-independent protein translocase protein TatB
MFDIGWSELLLIGIVALIAIGPKELPTVLRTAGHWMGKLRRMAADFQGQFQEALREAEIADLKKQFDEASEAASSALDSVNKYDPLESTRKDVETAFEEPPKIPDGSAASEGTGNGPAAALATGPASPEETVAAAPAPDLATPDLGLPLPETPPPVQLEDPAQTAALPEAAPESKPKSGESAA